MRKFKSSNFQATFWPGSSVSFSGRLILEKSLLMLRSWHNKLDLGGKDVRKSPIFCIFSIQRSSGDIFASWIILSYQHGKNKIHFGLSSASQKSIWDNFSLPKTAFWNYNLLRVFPILFSSLKMFEAKGTLKPKGTRDQLAQMFIRLTEDAALVSPSILHARHVPRDMCHHSVLVETSAHCIAAEMAHEK